MGWIPLSKGMWAEVSDVRVEELSKHKWHAKKGGDGGAYYAARNVRINGKVTTIRMHRQITDCPVGMEVHHWDSNTFNNRDENLLVCTRKVNLYYRDEKRETTGYLWSHL